MKSAVMKWTMFLGLLVGCMTAAGESDYEQGMELYEQAKYQEAFDVFSELFKQEPDSQQVNFALGMAALSAERYSHALFAFDRVLMQNPSNDRARLELARTYYLMGQYEMARTEFEAVLQHETPEQVRRNVQAYLDAIESRTRPWDVNLMLAVSGFHDDNVNYGPSSVMIDSELGELQVATNSRPISVYGLAMSARGEVSYDFGAREYWAALVDAGAYNNWLDDANDQEMLYYGGSARLRRSGPRTLLDLPLRADRLVYGHDPLVDIVGTEPALIWVVSPDWVSISRVGLEYRDYVDNSQRDGPYYRAMEMIKRYFADGRHFVTLEAGGFHDKANNSGYENYGWQSALGVEMTVYGPFSVYGLAQYRWLKYRDELYPDLQKKPRQDDQYQWLAGALMDFPQK
jgi:tetratricopeptide (TPR) repeat protein